MTAEAQQPRAPAGGMFFNGQFYKGGQFMPNAAGGFMPMPYWGLGGWDPGIPMTARARVPRAAARAARAAEHRVASNVATNTPASQLATARSRLAIAGNLIKQGKNSEARVWLNQVVAMKASPQTVDEAKEVLKQIDPSSPRPSSAPASPQTVDEAKEVLKQIDPSSPRPSSAPASPQIVLTELDSYPLPGGNTCIVGHFRNDLKDRLTGVRVTLSFEAGGPKPARPSTLVCTPPMIEAGQYGSFELIVRKGEKPAKLEFKSDERSISWIDQSGKELHPQATPGTAP
jgi:hypothetical protein